MTTLCLL